jgi:hypothetical protein
VEQRLQVGLKEGLTVFLIFILGEELYSCVTGNWIDFIDLEG